MGQQTKFPSPGYPFINYICLAFLAAVIVFMTQLPDTRLAVGVLPVWLLVLWIGYHYRKDS
jgi:AAT family amino acid transporter/aromatic amino acid transport protein AroP